MFCLQFPFRVCLKAHIHQSVYHDCMEFPCEDIQHFCKWFSTDGHFSCSSFYLLKSTLVQIPTRKSLHVSNYLIYIQFQKLNFTYKYLTNICLRYLYIYLLIRYNNAGKHQSSAYSMVNSFQVAEVSAVYLWSLPFSGQKCTKACFLKGKINSHCDTVSKIKLGELDRKAGQHNLQGSIQGRTLSFEELPKGKMTHGHGRQCGDCWRVGGR